jgi:hypothetical protein
MPDKWIRESWQGGKSDEKWDFRYVKPTNLEIDEYINKVGHQPRMYRVECKYCGKRIWDSGMGIGSHRKACKHWSSRP